MKTQSKKDVSKNGVTLAQKQTIGVLVGAALLVGLLTYFLSDSAVYEPDVFPPTLQDSRYYPAPNVIDARFESNLTNLIDGTSFLMTGTFDDLCEPRYSESALPNYKRGSAYYMPCGVEDSSLLTQIGLPNTFTLAIWVSPDNDTNIPLFRATNLSVDVRWGNVSAQGVDIQEFDAGMWTFVALTYGALKYTVYANSNYTTFDVPTAPSGLLTVLDSFFSGRVRDFTMWNYRLVRDEVISLYELSSLYEMS